MREFIIKLGHREMWEHQNEAVYTGDWFDGVLLDNYMLECKRGYCAVYEKPVNEWSSVQVYKFVPYKDREGVYKLFDEFHERQYRAELDAIWEEERYRMMQERMSA